METATMTLVEFLTARLDEDEAAARLPVGQIYTDPAHPDVALVRPPDTTRVLREVEAKRWLLDSYGHDGGVARVIAAVYADHPDYREEWRP